MRAHRTRGAAEAWRISYFRAAPTRRSGGLDSVRSGQTSREIDACALFHFTCAAHPADWPPCSPHLVEGPAPPLPRPKGAPPAVPPAAAPRSHRRRPGHRLHRGPATCLVIGLRRQRSRCHCPPKGVPLDADRRRDLAAQHGAERRRDRCGRECRRRVEQGHAGSLAHSRPPSPSPTMTTWGSLIAGQQAGRVNPAPRRLAPARCVARRRRDAPPPRGWWSRQNGSLEDSLCARCRPPVSTGKTRSWIVSWRGWSARRGHRGTDRQLVSLASTTTRPSTLRT